MPISKSGNPYYTKEQYQKARYESSALDYARSQGYNLVKQGQYYTMKEHDSMVFTPRGNWFWNSRGVSGGALEFMMYYEGKNIIEAVLTLAGEQEAVYTPPKESVQTLHKSEEAEPPHDKADASINFQGYVCSTTRKLSVDEMRKAILALEDEQEPPHVFTPPPRADNFRRLYGYLCGTRKLSKEVVGEMIRQNILYEANCFIKSKNTFIHNACFASLDDNGKMVSCFLRGLNTYGSAFKGEGPYGDKSWGWLLRGQDPSRLVVFEACIDAASYVTLQQQAGLQPLQGADYMALGGMGMDAITRYLENHPDVRHVTLALDNDHWGRLGTQRIGNALEETGVTVSVEIPQHGKDWNEQLQAGVPWQQNGPEVEP